MATECMTVSGPAWILAGVTLTIASVFDIRSRRIPNWLTAGSFGIGLVNAYADNTIACAVMSALLPAIVIVLPNFIRPGAIGVGDVKLVGAVGASMGTANTLLAVGAAACGSVAYLSTFMWPPWARDRPTSVPFAPFLLAGFLISDWVQSAISHGSG